MNKISNKTLQEFLELHRYLIIDATLIQNMDLSNEKSSIEDLSCIICYQYPNIQKNDIKFHGCSQCKKILCDDCYKDYYATKLFNFICPICGFKAENRSNSADLNPSYIKEKAKKIQLKCNLCDTENLDFFQISEHQKICILNTSPIIYLNDKEDPPKELNLKDKILKISKPISQFIHQFQFPLRKYSPLIRFIWENQDPSSLICMGLSFKGEDLTKIVKEKRLIMDSISCFAVAIVPSKKLIVTKIRDKIFKHENIDEKLFDFFGECQVEIEFSLVSVQILVGKYRAVLEIESNLAYELTEEKILFFSVKNQDTELKVVLDEGNNKI